MLTKQKIILAVLTIFIFSTLQAQIDSVMNQRDSAIVPETDPTVLFFQQGEKAATPSKLMLLTKTKKTVNLSAFLKNLGEYGDHVLADLDNDGKKELLVSNFTGGAHCCDEIYIFKNIAPGKYQHVVKLFAGNTVITEKKEFLYNFYEQFGYFFTCYACAYTDTTDAAPVSLSNIVLNYNKGKVTVVPGDKDLRSNINDNLGKLGELPYEKPEDEMAQDNGQRKEFALNLAVFYYSFGRNILETQKLFNKYYKFPDAKKVWTAFLKQLQYIRKENDF
jgi:hypothetical protein